MITYEEIAKKEIMKLNEMKYILLDCYSNLSKGKILSNSIYGNAGVYSSEKIDKLIDSIDDSMCIIDQVKGEVVRKARELDEKLRQEQMKKTLQSDEKNDFKSFSERWKK